jgi:hypothetical protein
MSEIRGHITKDDVKRISRRDFMYLIEDIELWEIELGEFDL